MTIITAEDNTDHQLPSSSVSSDKSSAGDSNGHSELGESVENAESKASEQSQHTSQNEVETNLSGPDPQEQYIDNVLASNLTQEQSDTNNLESSSNDNQLGASLTVSEQEGTNRAGLVTRNSTSSSDRQEKASHYESFSDSPGVSFVEGYGPGSLPTWASRASTQQLTPSLLTAVPPNSTEENKSDEETSGMDCGMAPVHAAVVDEEELERRFLSRLSIKESFPVTMEDTQESPRKTRIIIVLSVLLILLILACVAIGIRFGIEKDKRNKDVSPESVTPSGSPTITFVPTSEKILDRGYLNCGAGNGPLASFHKEMCRAIAAALFGSSSTEVVNYSYFENLSRGILHAFAANDTIDLLAIGHTYTMERDVYEATSEVGFTFSTPYLYEGIMIGGEPKLIDICINQLRIFDEACKSLKICVCEDCTHNEILRQKWFPSDRLVPIPLDDMYTSFMDGKCNAIAHERPFVANSEVEHKIPEYQKEYKVGERLFSKEPLALVTRDDDPTWSNFCNWVIQALFAGEKYNITQETAKDFPIVSSALGEEFENMFVDAIKAVGNYGEIYERYLEELIPRRGLDLINTEGNTGLIYSLPLGDFTSVGPGQTKGGSMEAIMERGYLVCGIGKKAAGFVEHDSVNQVWSGMDVDLCRALAAGVFHGNTTAVKLMEMYNTNEGFAALSNGTLDVMSGAGVTFDASVDFSFSPPYFYSRDIPNGGPPIALATLQSDRQWSSFVYWVVSCLFYAEEEGIENHTAFNMPKVELFGSNFASVFRHVVEEVGNYGQMYIRNLEKHNARKGTRNMLNMNSGPQHFPLL